MTPGPVNPRAGSRRQRASASAGGQVLPLDPLRIARALAGRARYKYVQPSIEAEGLGWKIVSPNCSRNIDPTGGAIAIAWFEPGADGRWQLHARDHDHGLWLLKASGLTLAQALSIVCDDEAREYWQ